MSPEEQQILADKYAAGECSRARLIRFGYLSENEIRRLIATYHDLETGLLKNTVISVFIPPRRIGHPWWMTQGNCCKRIRYTRGTNLLLIAKSAAICFSSGLGTCAAYTIFP